MRMHGEGEVFRGGYTDADGRRHTCRTWSIRYSTPSGRRNEGGFTSRKAALAALQDRLAADRRGEPAGPDVNRTTFEDGEKLIRDALDKFEDVMGADHPYTLEALDGLTRNLIEQERFEEAEPVALDNLAGRKARFGADHARTAGAAALVAEIQERLGRPENEVP